MGEFIMSKRSTISRKTEQEALEPHIVNRVETSFIAPYGQVSRQIVGILEQEAREERRRVIDHEAEQAFGFLNKYLSVSETPPSVETPKEVLTDEELIDKAGIHKNEKHARMMQQDFIAPHERRFNGEAWDVQEARAIKEQLEQLEAAKKLNRASAESAVKFGYLNVYTETCMTELIPEFETLNLDDPEIIPEGQTNSQSPIFTSTGRTFSTTKNHEVICVPMGDNGLRKELPDYAYRAIDSQEMTPVKITIPAYVRREDWLAYCLGRIM